MGATKFKFQNERWYHMQHHRLYLWTLIKGVGAVGGAMGAIAPTLFSKACFAPPPPPLGPTSSGHRRLYGGAQAPLVQNVTLHIIQLTNTH